MPGHVNGKEGFCVLLCQDLGVLSSLTTLVCHSLLAGPASFTSLHHSVKQNIKGFTKTPSAFRTLFVTCFIYIWIDLVMTVTYCIIINEQLESLECCSLMLPSISTGTNKHPGKKVFTVGRRDNTFNI